MPEIRYIEDIFLDFCELSRIGKIPLQPHDYSVINNFENVIFSKKQLTINQGNFLIKLLKKYQNFASNAGLDYVEELNQPAWQLPFRVLDLGKRIYIEQDEEKIVWVCLKFPFQLKKEFDSEFSDDGKSFGWDHDEKIRKNKVYDSNLISLYEFAQRHSFEIDDSFMSAMAQVEEIWQNQDEITPFSVYENGSIVLKNACEDSLAYFNENSSVFIDDNILLAKSMGYLFRGLEDDIVTKIGSIENNYFWIKDFEKYFELVRMIKDDKSKIVIILDRPSEAFQWLQDFSQQAEKYHIPNHHIKVCFREDKDHNCGLNDWIKVKGYGGKVEEGKIYIFLQKPAKWLFNEINNVKIITTTGLYPALNPIVRDLCNSHSCVIFLGNIKPSEKRDQRIVEL